MSVPVATPAEATLQSQSHRRRALSLAVATSLLSKGGTLLLMLIALPLAYRVLGPERVGVYSVLQSLMWLLTLADLGIGAGIARRLTLATSMEDRAEQSRVLSTGFYMMLGIFGVVGCAGALILLTVPVETLYGQQFAPFAQELRLNLWLGGGIFLTLMTVGVMVKIREAYQEIHVFNLFGTLGNVVSAALLYFGIQHVPQVWFILVAIYGVQIVIFLLNGWLALRQRPWLWPRWSLISRPLARSLAAEGGWFFVLIGVTPIFGREWIRWLLGHYYSPVEVGYFAILTQIGFLVFGIAFMLTYPLRPAVVDAQARGDYVWLRRTESRLQRLWWLAAVAVPGGLSLIGPWLVRLWFQQAIPLSHEEMGLYGCFLMLTIWTEIHCVLLSGLGKIGAAACIAGLECLAVALGGWFGVRTHGMAGGLLGATIGGLLTSFFLYPWLCRRTIRALQPGSSA